MADERTNYPDRALETEFRMINRELERQARVLNGLPGEVSTIKGEVALIQQTLGRIESSVAADQPQRFRRGDWISIGLFLVAASGTIYAIVSGGGAA